MAPLAGTFAVGGDEGERPHVRAGQRLDDERRRFPRQPPLAPLLPRVDEAPRGRVVDDRGACRRECDAASAALRAASDRPRSGRAAASAERRREPDQRVAAVGAERKPGQLAGGAPVRQEDVEQHLSDGTCPPATEAPRLRVNFVKRPRPPRGASRPRRARQPWRGAACCPRDLPRRCRTTSPGTRQV